MNNNLLISRKCVSGLGVAFLCLIMLLAGLPAMAQCPASDGAAACARENNDTPCQSADDAPLEDDVEYSRWYFCLGNSNNHPRLHNASKEIDREINKRFRSLAPGFDDVTTFSDQRDDFMIWTPFVILGRTLNDHWNVFAQVGYTAGKVRTKADDTSLILLPLHTDVEIKRSTFYAGVGAEYFPWGMPEAKKYTSLRERLKNTKPLVGATFNWNYLTADCDVRAGFKPFGNFIHSKEHNVWRTCNIGALAGVAIPVSERTTLNLNASYNIFLKYGDDFSGPSFSSFWQWRF